MHKCHDSAAGMPMPMASQLECHLRMPAQDELTRNIIFKEFCDFACSVFVRMSYLHMYSMHILYPLLALLRNVGSAALPRSEAQRDWARQRDSAHTCQKDSLNRLTP